MWEFEMYRKADYSDRTIIYGYDLKQAMRLAGLDPQDWELLQENYVD